VAQILFFNYMVFYLSWLVQRDLVSSECLFVKNRVVERKVLAKVRLEVLDQLNRLLWIARILLRSVNVLLYVNNLFAVPIYVCRVVKMPFIWWILTTALFLIKILVIVKSGKIFFIFFEYETLPYLVCLTLLFTIIVVFLVRIYN